jgi:hypothetical protein
MKIVKGEGQVRRDRVLLLFAFGDPTQKRREGSAANTLECKIPHSIEGECGLAFLLLHCD